jgi:hypothetical protein
MYTGPAVNDRPAWAAGFTTNARTDQISTEEIREVLRFTEARIDA